MRPGESFVQQPVRSLQTMLRVIAEDDPKQPTVVPDGIYGPTTMQAVTAFQRRNGLSATGITDQATWDGIAAAYETALIRIDQAEPIQIILNAGQVFREGDSSPYLFLLQAMLSQLSIDNPTILPPDNTGILDSATIEALRAFQQLAGLPNTGEMDKITWKHLVHHYALNANHNASKCRSSR